MFRQWLTAAAHFLASDEPRRLAWTDASSPYGNATVWHASPEPEPEPDIDDEACYHAILMTTLMM